MLSGKPALEGQKQTDSMISKCHEGYFSLTLQGSSEVDHPSVFVSSIVKKLDFHSQAFDNHWV
jgi:hypothetical protein